MENKELKFNIFFNNEGENLEKLVIQALVNYLNNDNNIGQTKC